MALPCSLSGLAGLFGTSLTNSVDSCEYRISKTRPTSRKHGAGFKLTERGAVGQAHDRAAYSDCT